MSLLRYLGTWTGLSGGCDEVMGDEGGVVCWGLDA